MVKIIWNITSLCSYNCLFCCSSSSKVNNNDVISLERQYSQNCRNGNELTSPYKFKTLYNIDVKDVYIDFSGGDPLLFADIRNIIKEASSLFGTYNTSVTTTGNAMELMRDSDLLDVVKNVDITYDFPHNIKQRHRPKEYNKKNYYQMKRATKIGLRTKAQLPIHPYIINYKILMETINNLLAIETDEIELMRYFPVGRNRIFNLDKHYYNNLVSFIDNISLINDPVLQRKLTLECALKGLNNKNKDAVACDMAIDKFGIDRYGNLFSCAWASNINIPIEKNPFYLGSLLYTKLSDLLNKSAYLTIKGNCMKNQPHCKVFSYLYGARNYVSCFTKMDPLYIV